MTKLLFFIAFTFVNAFSAFSQEATLHEFFTETNTIYNSDVATNGVFIYGTKFDGGSRGNGYVYRLATDGSDFQIIFDFINDEDGRNPVGGVILHEDYLYGMTAFGGTDDFGVIFKIKADGSEKSTILNFN